MRYIVFEKTENYEKVVDVDDIEILMKVSNEDIEKIREMKFEKMKDELIKTIEVTIDDIREAIEKGVIKPVESEYEWKKNLEEKGYGKYADIIIKHVKHAMHRKHVPEEKVFEVLNVRR